MHVVLVPQPPPPLLLLPVLSGCQPDHSSHSDSQVSKDTIAKKKSGDSLIKRHFWISKWHLIGENGCSVGQGLHNLEGKKINARFCHARFPPKYKVGKKSSRRETITLSLSLRLKKGNLGEALQLKFAAIRDNERKTPNLRTTFLRQYNFYDFPFTIEKKIHTQLGDFNLVIFAIGESWS